MTSATLTPRKDTTTLRPSTSTSELSEALSQAIELAKAAGADEAEAHARTGVELSVTARNGEVDTVEHNDERGVSITVYRDRCSGSATTNDLSPAGIQSTVDAAMAIARFSEPDEYSGLPEPAQLATLFPDLEINHPWAVNADVLADIAAAMDSGARAVDPRITQTDRSAVSSTSARAGYANSHGFLALTEGTRHGMSCIAIAEEQAGETSLKERDYWFDSRRAATDLTDPSTVGRLAAERAVRRLGARQAPTGRYPVLFESGVASSLIGHLIGAVSGGALYRKATFLRDSVGKAVLPERVTIHEEPLRPRGHGSSAFDSEGVTPLGGPIVEHGVLKRYVLSTYSARRLGLSSTGNAGGVRNLVVSEDGLTLQQLLERMDRGIFVTELMGMGVNLVNGDYSRGAAGYFVENGQIQYPVSEITIAGNLKDMFTTLNAIGSDVEDRGNVRCGSILLDAMTVAGA